MAIIKFFSDKACQLFIDMERVGDVQANKMLKLSLDTGSYLIEVKTNNGKCLKKYELKISPTDCQVLQDLSLSSDSLARTIEGLRNDSSLKFYNQRAVFYHDGKFGYINGQYKIAVYPNFSYAENFVSRKALVKRVFPDGEKATVIDTEGNVCLDQWYDYVGCNDKTILLRSGNTFCVLSHEDYLVINEYQNAKYDGLSELIPVQKEFGVDDMYGYIDKTGTEVIPLIYDYTWNFGNKEFAIVKRFGCFHAVGKNGSLYYNMEQAINDGTISTRKRGGFDEPGDADIVEIYEANKLSKEESIKMGFCTGLFEPIKEKGYWVLYCSAYDDYLRKNGDIVKCDRIFYIDDHYCAFRSKGVCKLLLFNDNKNSAYSFYADEFVFNADSIAVSFSVEHEGYAGHDIERIDNIVIMKNKKYGIVDLKGKTILPVDYDLIEPIAATEGYSTGNLGIIWKEGKCSFVQMSNGIILEPFKYEDIIVNNANSSTWLMNSTFLVKEKGKYGCIDFNRRPILPSIYDAIDFKLEIDCYGYHYKMLLHRNGRIGTYEYCNYRSELNDYRVLELVFSVEPEYDECVFLKNKYAVTSFAGMAFVAVRKGSKWGIIDNKPAGWEYYYDYTDHWSNSPNLRLLGFKYNSLEELEQDAETEFKKRRDLYNEYQMELRRQALDSLEEKIR